MTIFEFRDYRAYLRSYLNHLPKKGRGELTRIAQHLTVNTTLLSQILSGTRDFNQEQTFELSQYLGHTELEFDYFFFLVQFERAGTKVLKTHFQKKLEDIKQEALKLSRRIVHEKSLTDHEKSIFYSSWIFSAVHLFTSTQDKGVRLEEIADRFRIPRNKAAEIMQFLTASGLCTESSGVYKMGVQSTFVAQGTPHLLRHHSNWRIKAIQKSESISATEMMYTGQVSLSRKDFDLIREKFADILKNVMQVVKKSPAEDIACLNIDWFWIEK